MATVQLAPKDIRLYELQAAKGKIKNYKTPPGGTPGYTAPGAYSGIDIPKFKEPQDKLYAELLKKQLGYVDGAATFYDNPANLTQGYWDATNRSIEGDTYGSFLNDATGDTGAGAAYDLALRNKQTMGYNDLIKSVYSPEGFDQITKMKTGLYGPETLSNLNLFGSQQQQQKNSPTLLQGLLGVGSALGGLGWSPFG